MVVLSGTCLSLRLGISIESMVARGCLGRTADLTRVMQDLASPIFRQSGDKLHVERWIGTYPKAEFRDVCCPP